MECTGKKVAFARMGSRTEKGRRSNYFGEAKLVFLPHNVTFAFKKCLAALIKIKWGRN